MLQLFHSESTVLIVFQLL